MNIFAIRQMPGIIPATGKLVLKLYYDLNKYTVTYVFENPVPAGAQLPPVETKYAGDKVHTPAPSVPGYIFSGWTVQTPAGLEYKNGEFVMPAANVMLKGKFTAGEAAYKIEHYLMNDQGTYENVVPHVESKTGVVYYGFLLQCYTGWSNPLHRYSSGVWKMN